MKNIVYKIFLILFIFIIFLINANSVLAKYVINPSTYLIIETDLDRTPPILSVFYSELDNEGNIIVTINANEKVRNVEEWSLSEDKMTLTKKYTENKLEDIEVYDIAGNKSTTNINVDNIDKIKPFIEKELITNSNTGYTSYANSSKEINLQFRVSDNLKISNVDLSKILIKVGNTTISPTKNVTEISKTDKERIYNLKMTNISGNGGLVVTFAEGFAIDTKGNKSIKTDIDTEIIIDNISPTATYSQDIIAQGKVKAYLNADEQIRQLNGWDISVNNKILSKDFVSNVSYELKIYDLAGNSDVVNVSVTGATYIKLTYASHNSEVGWTYGFGNYDIAGKSAAINSGCSYKTEAIAFNIEGNIENDFFQANSYIYTKWSNDNYAECKTTGMLYKGGYNPSISTYKTMESSDLVTIDGKRYIQFGGAGINGVNNTDIYGNDPITQEERKYTSIWYLFIKIKV